MRMVHCFVVSVVAIIIVSQSVRAEESLFPPISAVKPDHPRLLLRPNKTRLAISIDDMRAMPHDADFKSMLDRLESLDDASAQAMVWLLTDNASAADKAMKRMMNYSVPAKANTFEAWFRLREFGLAYDWLYAYPKFDKEARAKARTAILPLAHAAVGMSDDHVFHNYTWMSSGGLTFWALATAGEDEECNRLYEIIRQRWNTRLYPAIEYMKGLPSEPMGYWSFYIFTPAVQTILAAQSATETDLISAIRTKHGSWLERIVETEVQFTLPDLRFVPWGDLQEGPNGGVGSEMAGTIDAATWGAGSSHGRWLSQRIAQKVGMARFKEITPLFYMLYTRSLEKSPTQAVEPALSYLGGNHQGGQFIARSGWGDGDTIVGFRCADFFGNHHHFDQGSFLIYRRGLLAVDPPVYKKTRGPQGATDYHNTLLIDGHAQRPVEGQNFKTLQAFRENLTEGKRLETGDILWWHEDGKWAGVAGQFAQAYGCAELKSCVRQLVFIRPGTVIVVDRLQAVAGKRLPDVQWLLQLPAVPRAEKDYLVADNGQSWIRCRPLQPLGVQPNVTATQVHTQCAKYIYPGGKVDMLLVHLIDVGDGTAPPAASAVKIAQAESGLNISIEGQSLMFDTAAPYAVRAAR
ncbi:MAG TPA: heparinase II/III family protein [Humisphaera sp.]|nr:heparinase II/III family protein [Humisphaera sp.]